MGSRYPEFQQSDRPRTIGEVGGCGSNLLANLELARNQSSFLAVRVETGVKAKGLSQS